QDGIQLAVGCTYKYLNGGPGAVAFLHVSPELQSTLPGMTGWFGSDPACQFAMTREFQPAADAGRFLLGTPHILSLAPLLGTLPMFLQIGIEKIRKQSLELTCFLREMVEQELSVFGVQCVTPKADADRGGHITLQHPEAGRLSQALRERGIIPDFRSPDLLRLAPSPLYTTYRDIVHALTVLKELLVSGSYLESKHHSLVT
ncbi:MAG TPA: hypothetical protein PKA06_16235, partial [Gemmatales bacterium]|nr:hypothetical protein [Gemmatales bacterium]